MRRRRAFITDSVCSAGPGSLIKVSYQMQGLRILVARFTQIRFLQGGGRAGQQGRGKYL